MGLPLSPFIVSRAYEYLRATPPFRRWKLPPADEVRFHITDHKDREGDSYRYGGKFHLRVSRSLIGHTDSLLSVVGHEMIHLYEYRLGIRSAHGKTFRRRAARVCHYHGWDLGIFIGVR